MPPLVLPTAPLSPSPPLQWLAWAGWALRVPRDWRPLRIEGTQGDGSMVLGDAQEVLARVRWHRGAPDAPGLLFGGLGLGALMRSLRPSRPSLPLPGNGGPEASRENHDAARRPGRSAVRPGFDAARWIARHARHVAPGVAPDPDPPRAPGFPMALWLPGLEAGAAATKCVWYGWNPEAQLLFEAVLRDTTSGDQTSLLAHVLLPSLQGSDETDRLRWAVFDVSFESPPGFRLIAHRLQVGDMALRLEAPDGRLLTLRQVYPASLALTRRDLHRWLAHGPFPDKHRTVGHEATTEVCRIATPHGTHEGVRRRAWKRLAWPLGACRPWRNVAVVLHDRGLDRLLLAECDSPGPGAEETVAQAVVGMNWARLE